MEINGETAGPDSSGRSPAERRRARTVGIGIVALCVAAAAFLLFVVLPGRPPEGLPAYAVTYAPQGDAPLRVGDSLTVTTTPAETVAGPVKVDVYLKIGAADSPLARPQRRCQAGWFGGRPPSRYAAAGHAARSCHRSGGHRQTPAWFERLARRGLTPANRHRR